MPGRIINLLRGFFGLAPPEEPGAKASTMTRGEAVNKAAAIAAEQGWLWVEPVEASLEEDRLSGRNVWRVSTNAGGVGYNVYVILDDETGGVLRKGENRTR